MYNQDRSNGYEDIHPDYAFPKETLKYRRHELDQRSINHWRQ
jgi:hypothetical protein